MVTLLISVRSGKVGGGSGKDQPVINRTAISALPTTIKYLAMGKANSSRELGNRGQPVAAMLDELMPDNGISATPPPYRTARIEYLDMPSLVPSVTACQTRASINPAATMH